MKRNIHLEALPPNYLFPEIQARKQVFLQNRPGASLISLGIGDTSEPIQETVVQAMMEAARELGTAEGYSGYGPEQGSLELRKCISSQLYGGKVDPEAITISDGCKCDLGRLQMLFGNRVSIAVQDPSYPVYAEGSLIQGVQYFVSMPCLPQNGFFPHLNKIDRTDLIYFCSPNNPTGAAASYEQLEQLVAFARKNKSIIIFDTAYSQYIQGSNHPKSIYEIPGAEEAAIEVGSFSKLAGFSGVRLGWTIVPSQLRYEEGVPVLADWKRMISTLFNGASIIAQKGGIAVLSQSGWEGIRAHLKFYLENTAILKEALTQAGYQVFGGEHAPYLWVRCKAMTSWQTFECLLERHEILVTPGSGFGPGGEGFIRVSAFGNREKILEAAKRLSACTTRIPRV